MVELRLDLQKGQNFGFDNRPQTLALQKGYKTLPKSRQTVNKHRRNDETFAACWGETL